ncbi:reverse transcriptase [Gossypium australe]|uniref:Reverse transcriptase n=1 Tax=Gossypium australe TaxID=47621 RepID=A0A5B6X2P1_9ROSI|nr:reverse transcriptase [Gossypium australe]
MSKAYDRVEWTFLKEMMRKMGFEPSWINSIMKCISTISYSVVLNGQAGNIFYLSRGLRQGDPLSLFLFLICGEGLSSLMRLVQRKENFRGVKVSRRGPQISHLLFADGCILFGEATERGVALLKRVLREYRNCSGKQVNFDKSTVLFSSNTREDEKGIVTRILGVRSSNDPKCYLGLPNMVGKRKKEAFQNLKDRFRQIIDNWSIRHLSQGGKEVFIKAIIQAISTYTMACFLLPKTLCSDLESIIVKFWWQKGHGQREIHWCNWKELCISKEKGGLGFHSLDQFNIALLANVWEAKGLPEDGLCWRIGKGDRVSVWNDCWIPGVDINEISNKANNSEIELVSGLIETRIRRWKRDLIENTFLEHIAQKILQIPLAEEEH